MKILSKMTVMAVPFSLFFFLFLMLHPELWSCLDKRYLGTSDALIYVWLTHITPKYFFSSFYDLPFFYPADNSLAFSDNYLLPTAISSLIRVFTTNDYLAFNVPLLIASSLNGTVAFLLVRRLTGHALAALLAGTLFMLSPLLVQDFIHPQMQFAFFLPATIYAVISYLSKKTVISAFSCGSVIFATFLCSVYYAFFACLLLTISLLIGYFRRDVSVRELLKLFLVNVPWMGLLSVFAYPYYQVSLLEGTRQLSDIEGIKIESLFEWLGIAFPFKRRVKVYAISTVFWILIALTLFPSIKIKDREKSCLYLLSLLMIVFCFLSFGPVGSVGRDSFHPGLFPILYEFIPGVSALRAAFRSLTVSYLCLAVLLSCGTLFLTKMIKRPWISGGVWMVLLFFPIANALRDTPIPTQGLELFSDDSVYLKLNDIERDGAVISLPFPPFPGNETSYARHQLSAMVRLMHTGRQIVNGYSGIQPRFHRELGAKLVSFPSQISLDTLKSIDGLRFVIIDSEYFSGETALSIPSLKLLHKDKDGRFLYELT